jgi:hypothetical protein
MKTFQIVLISIVVIATLVVEYFLLFRKTWPWEVAAKFPNIVLPAKKCGISANVYDYSNKKIEGTEIECTKCINYIEKSKTGCKLIKYDGDKKCVPDGDERPCPFGETTYAQYKIL